MELQASDKIQRDLTSSSSPPANKSMMYSKILSGRGWERRIEWTYDQPHTVVKWYQEAHN